ncbi:MAG TPA: hypothetical protein HA227_02590 [Candidatus Diapherotrites archaeon]|uniref:Uncharacterized protein n=2 Tax=Candidatus Iainarchaeum sp. TaxID=3101447 RepID=A0A7J4KTG5_9ARCH|nr:hypothetical protein [Candidatus Diapherotrites archaeon]
MPAKGYFIQYKFIIPETMKHSDYTYQKLFRAIYGYTQRVTKSSGKSYAYHRKGILSTVPYVKHGKNCVIVPTEVFANLKNFFLTGNNPTHRWQLKGDWKAVYYLNEKDLEDSVVVKSLEELLDRTFILSSSKEHQTIESELKNTITLIAQSQKIDEGYKKVLLDTAQKIAGFPWFKQYYSKSERLMYFNKLYNDLRTL